MRKTFLFLPLFLLLLCGAAWATEGGGGAYANGAEDFNVGYCVKPGLYFTNYFVFVKSERFNDRNGDSAVPGFDVEAIGNGFKFSYITDKKLLGGNWGMYAAVPVVALTVKAAGTKKHNAGLGDILVNPMVLGWQRGSLCYAAGVNLFLPTGEADRTKPKLGRGYVTFEPLVSVSYLKNGWDLSGVFYYDFNTKNTDTDYLSGQEFHFDYTIGKRVGDFNLGAGGYFYQQTTADSLRGNRVAPDGNKGQAFAIGPELRYIHKNMRFTVKFQEELMAYNRPQAQKLWFKFAYIF